MGSCICLYCARSEVLSAVLVNIQVHWFVKAALVFVEYSWYLISVYFIVHSMQKEMWLQYIRICMCVYIYINMCVCVGGGGDSGFGGTWHSYLLF
jgi:hypothetical protein